MGFAVPMLGGKKFDDAGLTQALLHLWPNLLAYILSFAVIGIMWQNHHALMRTVALVDRMTVLLNLGLLGCTVFIPFATATLGTYPDTHAATFLYGLVLTSCATCYNLMLNHLVRAHRLHASIDRATIRATLRAYRIGWITYAIAMFAALLSPYVSFALYILIVAYYWVPRGIDDDLAATEHAP